MPNASPYRDDKQAARTAVFAERARDTALPIVYCNLVGGQDELVFDGRSVLVGADGRQLARGPLCEDQLLLADYDRDSGAFLAEDWPAPPEVQEAEWYRVLERGLRDYVHKNGFSDVVFGLSGGVDSALTLALAVDAFGPERVHGVMMPSRHTSQLSLDLAREQAETLGVDYRTIDIEPAYRGPGGGAGPVFCRR